MSRKSEALSWIGIAINLNFPWNSDHVRKTVECFCPKRKERKMNIVVLSASPRTGGNTSIMVDAFREGAEAAGNTVNVIDVAKKSIAPCKACTYCFAHNGACSIDDDMTAIRSGISKADMLVFASPIYWFDISAQMKLAIDRMYAFAGCGFNHTKVALLLNSGSPGVYDAAIAAYKAMNNYLKWEDMGIYTIPGMEAKGDMAKNPKLAEVRAFGESLG